MLNILKKVWFTLVTLFVLFETALTFYFLYRSAEEYKVISTIVMVLSACYIGAFVILFIMSAHAKKYSKEALGGFKKSRKAIKRILNLIIVSLNIFYAISLDGAEKIYPLILLGVNVLLIIFDFKMAEIADKLERKRKKKERLIKKEKSVKLENNIKSEKETNYNKHKKRKFFGDFSNK